MSGISRENQSWKLPTRSLVLGDRTLVMAIVNVTPDSFSDGGFYATKEAAIARGLEALSEGADLLDIGAESTRPGSHAGGKPGTASAPLVTAAEEQERLLPVLEGILKERPETIISVDTYKAATARAALSAGAAIVNDVSGFLWDTEMPAVCAQMQAGVILGQTRGRPEEWAALPPLTADALVDEVRAGLSASLAKAKAAKISEEALVLDPCYGFGKRFEENYSLLARQEELLQLGRPLLAGLSRKSFLGRTLSALRFGQDAPPLERENASLAALVAAILHGASIVRVHAVRPAVEAVRVADALLAAAR